MRNVICPYCNKRAEYTDSKVVYGGKSYGKIYLCKDCNAYVGVHKGTDKPLGRLADKELRHWKKEAHAAFDPVWQSGQMKRAAAYKWLAEQMNLTINETHIGMFDVEQCKQVVRICNCERGNPDERRITGSHQQ